MSEINISTSIKDIIAVSNVAKGNKAVKNSNSSKFQDFLGEASDSKSGDKVDLYSNDLGSSSSDKDDNTVEKSDEHNNLKDISSKQQLIGKIEQNIQELLALMSQQSNAVNIHNESSTDSNSSVTNELINGIKQVGPIATGENKFSLNYINSKISLIISDIKSIAEGTRNVDLGNIQDNKNNRILSNEEISTLKNILSGLENSNGNNKTSVNKFLSENYLSDNGNVINNGNDGKNADVENQSTPQITGDLKILELVDTSGGLQQNHINEIETDESLNNEKFIGQVVNELKKVVSLGEKENSLNHSTKNVNLENPQEDKNNSSLNAKKISTLKNILSELENLNVNSKTSVNRASLKNDLLNNTNIVNTGSNTKNIHVENQGTSQITANLKPLESVYKFSVLDQNYINQIGTGEPLDNEKLISQIVNELEKLNGNNKASVNKVLSESYLLTNGNIINTGNNSKNIIGENQSKLQITGNLKPVELVDTSGILHQNYINQIEIGDSSDNEKLISRIVNELKKVISLGTHSEGNLIVNKENSLNDNIRNVLPENSQENKSNSLLNTKEISTLKNILSELENLNENNNTSVNKSFSADKLSQNKDNDFLKQLINNNSDNQYSKVINLMNQFALNSANSSRQNENVQPTVINKTNFTSDLIKSLSYMEDNNVKDMTVKIMPKELGEVMIKITSDSGIMKATITATNKDTYNLLNSNLHEINNSLNNNHVKIHSLDINIYNNDTTYFSNNSNFSQFDGRQNENTNNQSSNLNLNNNLDESQDKLEDEITENNNVNVLV